MNKIKVLAVFGTRPEAIKMAPLVKELKRRREIECRVCVTAQHRQMLDQVLKVFNIAAEYDLDLMKQGQTLSQITTGVICECEKIIIEFKPDIVLVHGDTTTAMATALAAFYNKTPVGHVEAGLRTYNKFSPYPEEVNRQFIDVIADMYFAPTEQAKNNLLKENTDSENIFVTGNTVIDALKTTVTGEYTNDILDWVGNDKMILLTAHRRENLGEPMKNIFTAVRKIADEFEDVKIVYPMHLNPQVRQLALKYLGEHSRIRLTEPLDVFDFHNFQARSYLILTDSGGIQEEAPSFGVPVLVLRDTTERPEGIEAGTIKLCGTDGDNIYNETKKLLISAAEYEKMSGSVNPYGDGNASVYIADAIINKFFK